MTRAAGAAALLLLASTMSPAQAQVSREWVARHASPTPYNDVPYAMTVDAYGHVYVTGTAATAGSNDWATIKYSPAGVQEWLRTLDGGGSDAALAIVADDAGNVHVTGSSGGGLYYLTAKYTAAGERLWVQSFADIGEGDAASDIAVDHDGNVYVTGYSTTTGTGLDIVTIKYNPGGAELWVRRHDSGQGEDVPAAIACDASGLYVTGRSSGDYTTIKYDFDGARQWVRTYDGPAHGSDAAAALVVDAAGHLYVTGQSAGVGTNTDYATIKYDAAGTEHWVRRYDGPSTVPSHDNDRAASLAVDASGNVFVTGSSADDFATVKYDPAGTEIWVRRYGLAGADGATAIAVDAMGNSYVSGWSFGSSATQYDFATLSYDPSGAVRWTERYDGPAGFHDTPYSIAVDSSGDVYVSGSSGGNGTGLDYTTIKYARPSASVAPGVAARGFFALQCAPNPFTPAATIRFTIPAGTGRDPVRLAVYDLQGVEVALLVNEVLAPGSHERTLLGSALATGVYWSRLEVGARSETRKLIHVR